MRREKPRPHGPQGSFPADAAESRSPRPCAICGRLTVSVPPQGGFSACSPKHARLAAEAQEGTSRSTVILGTPGASLALRVYPRTDPLGGTVRIVACETSLVSSAATGGDLTASEARRIAGALLRAADKVEGTERKVARA